jgi:hypothetical protein
MAAGRTTAEDWVRSLDYSICLLQNSRLGCKAAVSNVATKSMDGAPARGQKPPLITGGFLAAELW